MTETILKRYARLGPQQLLLFVISLFLGIETLAQDLESYKQSGLSPQAPEQRAPKDLKIANPEEPVTAVIYANCDDAFVMHHNGIEILKGNGPAVARRSVSLRQGDLLTVKAWNLIKGAGFSCVVVLGNGTSLATGKEHWRTYEPKDLGRWSTRDQIRRKKRPVVSQHPWRQNVIEASGHPCDSLWGKNNKEAYLYLEVSF